MSDFGTILTAARQLPEQDRLRLIDALWDTVPADAESPFSDEWLEEIDRRSAQLDAAAATTTPWPQIRAEALSRVGHGQTG